MQSVEDEGPLEAEVLEAGEEEEPEGDKIQGLTPGESVTSQIHPGTAVQPTGSILIRPSSVNPQPRAL